MADRSIDKREQYVGFATHCLQLAKVEADRQSRAVLREMAAEWLKLAEVAVLPSQRSILTWNPPESFYINSRAEDQPAPTQDRSSSPVIVFENKAASSARTRPFHGKCLNSTCSH